MTATDSEMRSSCILAQLTHEVFVVGSRSKQGISGLIAWRQLRRFCDRVVIGTPHELDGVAN